MKRIVQVLAVMFGLAMLVAYVVYSQQHRQKSTVAPSSKSKAIAGQLKVLMDSSSEISETNRTVGERDDSSSMVAPGPKSAPIFEPTPAHDVTVVATNQVKP